MGYIGVRRCRNTDIDGEQGYASTGGPRSTHTRTDRSDSIEADAIMFCVGCVATATTTSVTVLLREMIRRHYVKVDAPVCPSKICTTSLLCRFHKYTLLSSLPLTIHFPPVTLKHAAMQYF